MDLEWYCLCGILGVGFILGVWHAFHARKETLVARCVIFLAWMFLWWIFESVKTREI